MDTDSALCHAEWSVNFMWVNLKLENVTKLKSGDLLNLQYFNFIVNVCYSVAHQRKYDHCHYDHPDINNRTAQNVPLYLSGREYRDLFLVTVNHTLLSKQPLKLMYL